MATTTKAAETLRNLSIYRLSNEASCAGPDSNESAGARFLDSVRDAVIDHIEYQGQVGDPDDWSDTISEIADNAPDVYTSTLWAEFVDLAAYTEDPTEFGFSGSDMEQGARICLYMIAERLARRLFEIAATNDDEDDDDDAN